MALFNCELDIQKSDDSKTFRQAFRVFNYYFLGFRRQIGWRDSACAIPGVHACFLNVFEDASEQKFSRVISDGVDIYFSGIF